MAIFIKQLYKIDSGTSTYFSFSVLKGFISVTQGSDGLFCRYACLSLLVRLTVIRRYFIFTITKNFHENFHENFKITKNILIENAIKNKLYSVIEQPISIEIIFSRILNVSKRRTPKRNFGRPKQIRERPITIRHS